MKYSSKEKWEVHLMQDSIEWNLGLSTVPILHSTIEMHSEFKMDRKYASKMWYGGDTEL